MATMTLACLLFDASAMLFNAAGLYAQVYLLNPTPFCQLFAGLSNNKSATFLFFSYSQTQTRYTSHLFIFCFFLTLSETSSRKSALFPFFPIQLQ